MGDYTEPSENFRPPGTLNNQAIVGATLASAATIAPKALIHRVTGNTAIDTITPPWPAFAGILILIAAAGSAWTWTTNGNIALASGAAQTVGKAVIFVYDPVTGKWSPHSTVAG